MNELTKINAWIEGETEAQDLIYTLADKITGAVIPNPADVGATSVTNKWEEVYREESGMWVTYSPTSTPGVVGKYQHTDGKLYDVYKLPDMTAFEGHGGDNAVTPDGFVEEYRVTGTANDFEKTGKKVQVRQFSYLNSEGTEIFLDVPGLLVVNVEDGTTPLGFRCYVVEQVRTMSDGSVVADNQWSEFKVVTVMPSDWDYLLTLPNRRMLGHFIFYNYTQRLTQTPIVPVYTYTLRRFTTHPVHSVRQRAVVKATPDVPEGMVPQDYYVLLEQPVGDFNYIDVYYGLGFEGTPKLGDSKITHEGICDPLTVRPGQVATVIDHGKAQEMYDLWNSTAPKPFTPPTTKWQKDFDGITDLVSPPYHFFHGRDSTVTWLPNKKRRPDYLVGFHLAVNNDRVAIVLEGDPSPGINDYYRSFGYIGKIVPFNNHDHPGNFSVTVGMGDVEAPKTGFVANDIKENFNPMYAGRGEYTSNGVYSVSMLKTRSNVFFQAYYPAFITQLPNYSSVGTIPPELSKLILDKDGFQASLWTGKYHASPIYLVHRAEGYRGYFDGVVAIHDHNLVNLDELLVDTEIPKDPEDLSKGTWTEVYKFFSVKSPVNFFKFSPSPDVVTVAILKEIK